MKVSSEVTKASKKERSKEKNQLRLTKIKQWYIPADTPTYLVLRRCGIPLTRIHQNFLPTLKLLTKKHHLNGVLVDFHKEILDPFLDRLGEVWLKKEKCTCKLTATKMVFVSTNVDDMPLIKESLVKLEGILVNFFDRWGYKTSIAFSEKTGRCKLVVEYWYDSKKIPKIPIAEVTEELPKLQMVLGFSRLTLQCGPRFLEFTLEISQGGTFQVLHRSRCTYEEVKTIKPFMAGLMHIVNKDPDSLDRT